MSKELTDNEVHEKLVKAQQELGVDTAETEHGKTALDGARKVLTGLQFGVLAASEKSSD